jgi:hypothetical protein
MKKAHFSKLNEKETDSKVSQISRNGGTIVLWEKSQPKRFHFKIEIYDRENFTLKCRQEYLDFSLNSDQVLYHFTINGVSYFGEAKLSHDEEQIVLDIKDQKLFKAERRNSFRLLTYPHKKVFFEVHLDNLPEYKKSNVIMLNSGKSETGLFFNFLNLIGKKKGPSDKEETFRFRVHDVSMGGFSIEVGEMEKEFLQGIENFKNFKIEFEDQIINIISARIVYDMEYINPINNRTVYKLGFQIDEIENKTEQILEKKINALIRNIEEKFEDFIK